MNKESQEKFEFWMSRDPESFHQLDVFRMFDFASSLYKANEKVSKEQIFARLKQRYPNYLDEEAMRLAEKWEDEIDLIHWFLDWQNKQG